MGRSCRPSRQRIVLPTEFILEGSTPVKKPVPKREAETRGRKKKKAEDIAYQLLLAKRT